MRKLVGHLAAMAAIVLVGGLLSATLVRLAPGFGADEQQLDRSGDTLERPDLPRNATGNYRPSFLSA